MCSQIILLLQRLMVSLFWLLTLFYYTVLVHPNALTTWLENLIQFMWRHSKGWKWVEELGGILHCFINILNFICLKFPGSNSWIWRLMVFTFEFWDARMAGLRSHVWTMKWWVYVWENTLFQFCLFLLQYGKGYGMDLK